MVVASLSAVRIMPVSLEAFLLHTRIKARKESQYPTQCVVMYHVHSMSFQESIGCDFYVSYFHKL